MMTRKTIIDTQLGLKLASKSQSQWHISSRQPSAQVVKIFSEIQPVVISTFVIISISYEALAVPQSWIYSCSQLADVSVLTPSAWILCAVQKGAGAKSSAGKVGRVRKLDRLYSNFLLPVKQVDDSSRCSCLSDDQQVMQPYRGVQLD